LEDLIPKKETERPEKIYFNGIGEGGEFYLRIPTYPKRNALPVQLEIHGQEIIFNGRRSILVVIHGVMEKVEELGEFQQCEPRLEILIEGSSDLVGIIDRDRYYRYLSGAISAITGIKAEDLMAKHAFTFIYPGDVERVLVKNLGIVDLIEEQGGKLEVLLTWIEQIKISSKEMDEIVKQIVDEAAQLNIK
jgi:PAS domain-containing protein